MSVVRWTGDSTLGLLVTAVSDDVDWRLHIRPASVCGDVDWRLHIRPASDCSQW